MRYHNITKDDMKNGDGLRVVLWVSGCNHRCPECHNEYTWDPGQGVIFDEAAREELFEALAKDYISGVTFSGGDPLHPVNIEEIENLAKEVKEKYPGKTIWLYTGAVWKEVRALSIARYLDVLVDGEFRRELRDPQLHWRGSTNQRVIDVQASLETGHVVLHDE